MSGGKKKPAADPFDDIPDAFDDIPSATPSAPGVVELPELDVQAGADDDAEAQGFEPYAGPEQIPLKPVSVSVAQEPDTGLLDRFLDTASDAYHKFGSGAYAGLGMHMPRLAEAVGRYGGDALGLVSPEAGAAMAAKGRSAADAARERLALAESRSPIASGVAEVGGEIAATMPLAELAAPIRAVQGAGTVAKAVRAAVPVAEGAVQGALSSMGHADTSDWDERLEALKEGLNVGALFGAAGKLGEAGLTHLGTATADALRSSGLLNRVAATGAYGGDLKKLIERARVPSRAKQALEELGEWIEAQGIHVGEGPLGFLPQPASTYTKNAEAVNAAAMAERQAVLDAVAARPPTLTQSPVTVDTAPIISDLRQDAAKLGRMKIKESQGQAAHLGELADDAAQASAGVPNSSILGMPQQSRMLFPDALERREYLDSLVNHYKPGGPTADSLREEINRRGADEYRAGLQQALDTQMPDMGQKWASAQSDLHQGLEVQKLGAAREAKELGNQVLSLPTLIAGSGALGAGAGMYGGGDAGDNTLAGLGAAGLVGTAAALAKSRGHAGLAGVQKLGSQIARGVGEAAPLANVIGRGGAAWGGGNQGADVAPRIDDLAAPAPATAAGRGNLLPQAALTLIESDRGQLGAYEGQFMEAAGSPDPAAVASLIGRLTQSDPNFRRTLLPVLQRMTTSGGGGGGGF